MRFYKTSEVVAILEIDNSAIFKANSTGIGAVPVTGLEQRALCVDGEMMFSVRLAGRQWETDGTIEFRHDWFRVDPELNRR